MRSLPELVSNGTIDSLAAAALWTLVEHGQSIFVASREGGAGKTTLLTSLLDAIPAAKIRYWVRGHNDPIAIPCESRTRTVLLVNEISGHLPAYCWGESLERVEQFANRGVQTLATIHAESTSDILAAMSSSARPSFRGYGVFLAANRGSPDGFPVVREIALLNQSKGVFVRPRTPTTLDDITGWLPAHIDTSLVVWREKTVEELSRSSTSIDPESFASVMCAPL
jgi:hypothetical protein